MSHSKDERYTLPATRDLCISLAKVPRESGRVSVFDLDVCACRASHLAPEWYGLDHGLRSNRNGLAMQWTGHVWANVPFSNIGRWVAKAWREWIDCHPTSISMLVPAGRTDLGWWEKHVEPFRDRPGSPLRTHFLPGRIKFGRPGNVDGKKKQGSPPFGCVLLVWSRKR